MRGILLLSLLIQPFFWGAQSISIIDSKNKKNIPFAHISSQEKHKIYVSDFNGKVLLDSSLIAEDKLIISCLGYLNKKVAVDELKSINTIELIPKAEQLEEVIITAKKTKSKKKIIGIKNKAERGTSSQHFSGFTGEIKAMFIPNPNQLEGFINKVNVFITDKGFPNSYFRVHIYACNSIKIKPDQELTSNNTILKGNTGNEWLSIDIRDQRIRIPSNGFFVGIEWLPHTNKEAFKDTIIGKNFKREYLGNGVVVGLTYKPLLKSHSKIWISKNGQWSLPYNYRLHSYHNTIQQDKSIRINNIVVGMPCINTEISYLPQKQKSIYKAPKKRKLNKIERTKRDLYSYPQNSVENLFLSIIKTIENNNLIYALKYLCAYKNDELESIIDEISAKKEPLLSKNDKESILIELKEIAQSLNKIKLKRETNLFYELNLKGTTYHLIQEKGLWKINPYSYKVL